MSKINKIRFVNLGYNNNTMKIDDECFFLDGENTMLNLRNGGGKSVIVQMVMALFVNRRHRTIKDRTFESYFTTAIPTYILVEWELDDGAGYLLTGMMVRKKETSSDENSKEKLDIINFIHEYQSKNIYDINNLPIIEEKGDRRVIKSFSNSKKLFEDLKKDRDVKFNYYDMNNSVTTRSYFSKLEEYKINYREWETIIKQINLKESGLSELFIKAKDSAGLVKEWLLPAIENKLKKDEDRIKNYRELIDKYVKQYKANKANIDKKEKIELFKVLSLEVRTCCDNFINTIEDREEKQNEMANVIACLRKGFKEEEAKELGLCKLIEELSDRITELKYEEASIDIYQKEDAIISLKEEQDSKALVLEEKEKREILLKKRVNILECAKIHRQYQQASEELQQAEMELKLINKKNQDNAPHINNLGFSIRGILEMECEGAEESKTLKLELKKSINKEDEALNSRLKENRRYINDLKEKRGGLAEKVKYFNKVEESFNKKYNLSLFRSISGDFDSERLISVAREVQENKESLIKNRKNVIESKISAEELLKSKESEKIRNLEKISEAKNKLESKKKDLNKIEAEIETRVQVIKYIDFNESKVFHSEEIIKAFDRKLKIIKEEESLLNKRYDKLFHELEKLKSGKVLELSKEIEEKLKEKDINIFYGMEWLKKNGYSIEKNEELVRNNPFIPYSLIMTTKEIERLESEVIDAFTSNPISIINRDNLEETFNGSGGGELVELNGLRFFISFNNKLINERELITLIEEKNLELKNLEDLIRVKLESINLYEHKKNIIKYSSITREAYEELKEEIDVLSMEIINLREAEISLARVISSIKDEIERLETENKALEKQSTFNEAMEQDFENLKEEYEKYQKNRESLSVLEEKLKVINEQIIHDENRGVVILEELKACEDSIREYGSLEGDLLRALVEFKEYTAGEIINRDKEDLISEYNVLRKEISATEKELNERVTKFSERFDGFEKELNLKADSYKVTEAEYINETYNLSKEMELKAEYEDASSELSLLKDEFNNLNTKIQVAKSQLNDLVDKLENEFNTRELKSKEKLITKNFKEEIARYKVDIKEATKKKERLVEIKNNINSALSGLSEFEDYVIKDPINLQLDYENLNTVIGKLRRDLNNLIQDEKKAENKLGNLLRDIEIREEFKGETLFKDSLNVLKSLVNNPREFENQLTLVLDAYDNMIQVLMINIDLIEKEEGKILESLLEYIKDVHEHIEKIDDNSSINISNKSLKMLDITAANWEENKEVYKIRLKDYVEQIRNNGLKALEKNEDIEDIISNKINITKLYDEVVGISTVNIKLYKIEEDKQKKITWDEVAKNSGGEGFLSAFVILSSLLSYIRKDENDLFSRKEGGKVLIMDNPFAQTSSAHLLKPLMDIAKKSNTQLICLTGLGGDSIYNRFDNIYVLNLIPSKLKAGVKYLKGDHIKGEEEQEFMVASKLKIEEQIRLF